VEGTALETIRTRATELLPSVLLKLLSMIQALALELLWTRVRETPELWALDWGAFLGWLQVVVLLLGLLQVWLFYLCVLMRFQWVPTLVDLTLPFGIGILEFSLIDLLGLDRIGPWFVVLAAIFAVALWASHGIFRRARRDPANREFFDAVETATLRDFAAPLAAIAVLALLGIALHFAGGRGVLGLAALLVAIAALTHQVDSLRRSWRQSGTGPS
jgi:hypothetical protein